MELHDDDNDSDSSSEASQVDERPPAGAGRRPRPASRSVQQMLRNAVLYIHDTTPSAARATETASASTAAVQPAVAPAHAFGTAAGPARHASALPIPLTSEGAAQATDAPAQRSAADEHDVLAGLERRHLAALLRWAGHTWGLEDRVTVAERVGQLGDVDLAQLLDQFYATCE